MIHPCLSPVVASVLAFACSPATLLAQLLPGTNVVSAAKSIGTGSPGGLFLGHPLTPGSMGVITGLGPDLTGIPLLFPGQTQGAGCVLVRASDGALVVGEHTPATQTVDMHVITLNGTAVATNVLYPVSSNSQNGGSIDQMAWLGDDILISHRDLPGASGPLAGHVLGLVRPALGPGTPGSVVPVPVIPNPPGTINALAIDPIDPSGPTVYFGKFLSSTQSQIWSLPAPVNGVPVLVAPTLVATLSTPEILALAVDNNGTLWAGVNQGVLNGPALYTIDLVTGAATWVPTLGLSNVNGIAVETATGALMLVDGNVKSVWRFVGGVTTLLGTFVAPVGGFPTGIDQNPSLWTYGPATPGANSYAWQIAPNPGGLPFVGNANFSITMQSSPGVAFGVSALSLAPAALPALGITLLLDPATAVLWQPLPAQNLVTLPLPIPPDPLLVGFRLFAQSAHFEANGMAASHGLRIGIL